MIDIFDFIYLPVFELVYLSFGSGQFYIILQENIMKDIFIRKPWVFIQYF